MDDSSRRVRSVARIVPLLAAHAVGTASITLVVALSPRIEQSLDLGHAAFGLMVSAYYGGTLVLALPAGWMVDRYGLRAMLIVAHALLATGLVLLARSEGLVTGAAGLFLCGSGYAFINPATARAVLLWFPRSTRATAMSVKQSGVPIGGVVAALLAAAGHSDWRALIVGMAVITVVAAAGYFALRVAPQPQSHAVRFADIRALMRLPRLAMFNTAACLYATAQAAFFAYLVLYARDALGASIALASLSLAVAHVASATGRIAWGIVSDRMIRSGRIVCIVAIGICATVGVALLVAAPTLGMIALVATAALVGLTLGSYAGLLQTASIESIEPQRAGAAIGYNMLLVSLGTVLGPALFGAGVEAMGYAATWLAVSALLVVGVSLFHGSAR